MFKYYPAIVLCNVKLTSSKQLAFLFSITYLGFYVLEHFLKIRCLTLSFVCALSVQCLNTVGTVSVICLYSVCKLYINYILSVRPISHFMHCLSTYVYVHFLYTVCPCWSRHCLYIDYTLFVCCLYTICPLSRYTVFQLALHCPYTVLSFSVHWLYIVCTLSAYLILSPVFVQYCSAPSPYLHKV